MNKPDRLRGAASWKLQDAKTHLGEVVRRAENEGPQRVTVHGREAAVVLSTADYERLVGPTESDGERLIRAMRDCPVREFRIPVDRSAETAEDRAVEL